MLISTILNSSDLKFYFQRSFASLAPDSIVYLLDRMAQMWPQEKEIIARLKNIVENNPLAFKDNANWFRSISLDFLNYLVTGKRTEVYMENVSKKPVPRKTLENILSFPLANKRLNS